MGTLETIVWPDTYLAVHQILAGDEPIVVAGKLDVSEERCVLLVSKIDSLTALRDKSAKQGVLLLSEKDNIEQAMDRLLPILKKYGGNCPLRAKLNVDGAEVSVVLRDNAQAPICVMPSELLCDEVEQVFGRPVLTFF